MVGGQTQHWPTFFGLAINEVWRDRNSLVFNNLSHLGRHLYFQVAAHMNFIMQQQNLVRNANGSKSKTIEVAWQAPPDGCVMVNVDGSFISNYGSSACGGLATDSMGSVIKGFFYKVGACNAAWAELWGLLKGIELARDLALNWVIFEMDSKVIVDMVRSGSTRIIFLQPLLQEVISFLQLPDWTTSVIHTYREANQCANFLASKGHSSSFEGVTLESSFSMLSLLFLNDVRRGSTPLVV